MISSFIRTGFIESIERIEAMQTARARGGGKPRADGAGAGVVCYYESRNISLDAAWQRDWGAFASG